MSAPMIQAGNGLLYPALRKAGVTLGPGRTPSDAQMDDALGELNRLLGSLNCDRLFIWTLDILELPVDGSKSQWTIGDTTPPADFVMPRPEVVSAAHLTDGSDLRTQMLVATPQQWASRNGTSCPGQMMYYDRGYPVATIYLQSPLTGTLELYAWHQVPAFESFDDVVQLPPGYEDALVLNLAVRLGPQFQRPVDPNVRADARESLMRLESINAPQPIASFDDWFRGCGCGNSDC